MHFLVLDLRDPSSPETPTGDLEAARRLILALGSNATAYQILNPGITLWFSAAGDAVAGHVDWGGIRVVAGAPVCARERLTAVARELEEAAARAGKRVCYFAAGTRLESLSGARGFPGRGGPGQGGATPGGPGGAEGYSRALIGAQPSWDPAARPDIVGDHPSLRAQLLRARNKGVTVREWSARVAGGEAGPGGRPGSQGMGDLSRLEALIEEWLADRHMPPMGFLVEPRTLPRLWDRRVFVAEREGRPVAFLVAAPVAERKGWLIEQLVRGRGAPNGTAETLVDAAYRVAHAEGLRYFTLGLAPLSRVLDETGGSHGRENPLWLDFAFGWLRAHGGRFYDFEGLEQFKAKFRPMEWEPLYALCRGPFTPGVLFAIAGAFAHGRPFRFLAGALGRALRQEVAWFMERMLLRKPAAG